ncbi:MAG: protein kinase [Acidobacteriia bacterium]|nr:protein kinase [Terriglobia bacterium]
MIGRVVGNYRLVERLGEGAMGAVYKGVDLMVEREVAIKMLRPEIARQPDIVGRFHAEAVTLAKLNHPNIATLYSFFREGDEFFMVMEFVAGRTLDAMIRERPPMLPERAVDIAVQVLDAVEHAHSLGILHRDLKPANIMLTSTHVKVTDFGIARALGQARMTREGNIVGTLEYLAPERIRGQEADIRSDLYSVGVVLYEMLSGRLPFERDTDYELMRAQLEEPPPTFSSLGQSSIPAPLEEVVLKALAKLPEQRFGTAGEFRRALGTVLGTEPAKRTRLAIEPVVAGKPTRLAVEPSMPPKAKAASAGTVKVATSAGKPRWLYYGGATVLAAALVMAVALLWGHWRPNTRAVNPASPPVTAQPSVSAGPSPQAGTVTPTGALPAELNPTPTIQKQFEEAPPLPPGTITVSKPTKIGKTKTAAKPTTAERRRAALKALDEDENTNSSANKKKKNDKKERDPRASSLDALQK